MVVVVAAVVEGFGLFGFDTAAFEPCLDWPFSTFAHCLFVSASPRKAFFFQQKKTIRGTSLGFLLYGFDPPIA